MSLITSAATTATTTATTGVVTRVLTFVWDHTAGHAFYLINFEDNLESLRTKTSQLEALKDHVKIRVEYNEANHLTRTPVVDEWLRSVEKTLREVDAILLAGSQQIELRCIADCCLKNWWTCYLLGKEVSKKLAVMDGLISKGNFDVVAEVVPENPTVGMDAFFKEVWSMFRQDEVKIMGIYGMGGVGKTTLLRKIHNSFLQVAENKFDVVIWIVVSKEFSVERVLNEIGENLRLAWSDGQNEKKNRIFAELRRRKFVVLLDDLWQPMELEDIGIPSPHTLNNGSKVVFTTRSQDVCAAMDADKRFKVPVLAWDNAWTLFQQKLHREDLNSRPELQELAEEVAKECGGLPLALITMARAMSTKETALEWKHAISTLKQYASEFSGMKDDVLAPLKFSYDNLKNDTFRNCLVYCSLYPEGCSISYDNIVEHWIGEGFLDEKPNLDEARAWGHDIIGSLKAACLLESGKYTFSIKMHDVVRDMTLWIARDAGKKQNRILVQARGSTQAPDIKLWEDAERVSLIFSHISKLSKPPKSPYLLTLLIQHIRPLSSITPDFFQYMPVLRVLNLSHTNIREIPQSIAHLTELQLLNLSTTNIEMLPEELANLTKLRLLNLSYTATLKKIPQGMMAQLSKLQSLDLYGTGYDCSRSIEEFESLQDLRELHITIQDFAAMHSCLKRRRLILCLKSIYIMGDLYLTHFQLAPQLLLRNIEGLEKIAVTNCRELKELKIDCANANHNKKELLSTLKQLGLRNLPKLDIVWTRAADYHFKDLMLVHIDGCDALKEMSWLVLVPFLCELIIINCKEIEEILVDEVLTRASAKNQSVLSRLEYVKFSNLPKLQSISRVALPFPSLVFVIISSCPLLKKLPFTSNSTKTSSLQIVGETKWWDELEWEDERVWSSFQSLFHGKSDSDESDENRWQGTTAEELLQAWHGTDSDSDESDDNKWQGTMAEDTVQAFNPVFPSPGQQADSGQPSDYNFRFGAPASTSASSGGPPYHSGTLALQNLSPFQAGGNLEVFAGSTFSLGSGGLTEVPGMKSWKDAERVSLTGSDITKLPKPIQSPCLVTLLLDYSRLLSITPDFFQCMPLLRVLNLSYTGISEIPNSIGYLAELRYLNLSSTRIVTLPEELANLGKLRLLDLSGTIKLKEVPRGVIPRLLSLQSLNLDNGWCHPSVVEEVESLKHLKELHMTVQDFSGLSERLRSCLKSITIIESESSFKERD